MAGALAGVVMVAGLVIPASPAMASGGGCKDHIKNGWNVGVCSSDNGVRVYGDFYVNTRGSLGSECYIVVWLMYGTSGDDLGYRTDGCASGHHPASSAVMPAYRGPYYTLANVFVNDKIVLAGASPYTYH